MWAKPSLSGEHNRESTSLLRKAPPYSSGGRLPRSEPTQGWLVSAPGGRSKASLGTRRNGEDQKSLRIEKTQVQVQALSTSQPVSATENLWWADTKEAVWSRITDGDTARLREGSPSSETARGSQPCKCSHWPMPTIWWDTEDEHKELPHDLEQFTYPFQTPVFSSLGWMPGLRASLDPFHFKSYDGIPLFPQKLSCTCPKSCLPLLLAEVGAIRELGGGSTDWHRPQNKKGTAFNQWLRAKIILVCDLSVARANVPVREWLLCYEANVNPGDQFGFWGICNGLEREPLFGDHWSMICPPHRASLGLPWAPREGNQEVAFAIPFPIIHKLLIPGTQTQIH